MVSGFEREAGRPRCEGMPHVRVRAVVRIAYDVTPGVPPWAVPVSCTHPNVPAKAIHVAPAEIAPIAVEQGITGVVQVKVSLDANSRITAVSTSSSPSAPPDRRRLSPQHPVLSVAEPSVRINSAP
jgi:hypothetical protein